MNSGTATGTRKIADIRPNICILAGTKVDRETSPVIIGVCITTIGRPENVYTTIQTDIGPVTQTETSATHCISAASIGITGCRTVHIIVCDLFVSIAA